MYMLIIALLQNEAELSEGYALRRLKRIPPSEENLALGPINDEDPKYAT